MPTDRARRVYEKYRVICLVTMFTPRVMVIIIKMSKMVPFSYFLLVTVKNESQCGQNI